MSVSRTAAEERLRIGVTDRNAWHVDGEAVDLVRAPIPPRRCRLSAEPRNIVLDLNRTGLIVVDMQNDFCAPGGWFHSKGVDLEPLRRPIPILTRLVPELRGAGATIFWVNWGNRADIANLPPSIVYAGNPDGLRAGYGDRLPGAADQILVQGSSGAAIVDELPVDPSDVMIHKYRFSGFQDNDFDSILRNRQITTLLFAGINTDRCVWATLMDANSRGYDCVLVEDACSTASPHFCTHTVVYLTKKLYGFVTSTTAIHEGLRASEAT